MFYNLKVSSNCKPKFSSVQLNKSRKIVQIFYNFLLQHQDPGGPVFQSMSLSKVILKE